MKFSAQEEYGLRCLSTLAKEGPGGFLTIPTISKREGLSHSHVAKLLGILREAGFIVSVRGQSGGYMLARPVDQIAVRDVLSSLGGRLFDDSFCERHTGNLPDCVHESDCCFRPLWSRLQNAVDNALEGMTMADLLGGNLGPSPILVTDMGASA
ncbi:MAG: Rrf2 family transcriptional regulator [Armatimonadetes bacterium]|nr:Rrf2 family transcriptional regulator [Armatimonadota bacterium]